MKTETFEVIGSKGDKYVVTRPEDGTDWTCTCPHNTHRKVECKHIKSVKEQQTQNQ
jgi:uncharacterized Zn finger protein